MLNGIIVNYQIEVTNVRSFVQFKAIVARWYSVHSYLKLLSG